MTTNFFSPLSFVAVFGSGIRDPRSGIRDPGWVKIRIRDPGSGINIPDPQHGLPPPPPFYLSSSPFLVNLASFHSSTTYRVHYNTKSYLINSELAWWNEEGWWMELPNDLRDGLDVTRVLCISAYSLFICKVKRKIGTGKIGSLLF